MRIFYASDTSPNSAFESSLWRNNLYLPLIDLGHEVIEFQYDAIRETFQKVDTKRAKHKRFIKENRPRLTYELLKQIKTVHKENPIDMFFSYFYDACVLPETIDEIKSMGIKTVNWYCNGSYQLHLVEDISPHYDWCLVPEKFRLNDYNKMGANPIYCQEAANPNIYKPYELPYDYDVSFVGQAYGDRPSYIKYLQEQDININVFGLGWEKFSASAVENRTHNKPLKKLFYKFQKPIIMPNNILGGILSDTEMVQMYSRSKINIGFSTCGNTHKSRNRILQVRLRDFEVPMSGGFYIVEYMDELEEFFKIGKEIVCYKNKEDLADKIKYYLQHDDERETIRKAGYERCIKEHSWHNRFKMAFSEMDIK